MMPTTKNKADKKSQKSSESEFSDDEAFSALIDTLTNPGSSEPIVISSEGSEPDVDKSPILKRRKKRIINLSNDTSLKNTYYNLIKVPLRNQTGKKKTALPATLKLSW